VNNAIITITTATITLGLGQSPLSHGWRILSFHPGSCSLSCWQRDEIERTCIIQKGWRHDGISEGMNRFLFYDYEMKMNNGNKLGGCTQLSFDCCVFVPAAR
jgi:hypothetical protein